MNPFRLENEVALITGGGTGIGLAIARCMVESGARVLITGRREPELRKAAEMLGPACAYECFDVTHFAEAPDVIARIRARYDKVTILVNNAGIHLKKLALETSDDDFSRVLDVHLNGAFAVTRACLPVMMESGGGSVVFIASMAALFGIPQVVAYTAAKAACIGMVRALATEVSGRGVRVNAIAPGWIETEMLRQALKSDPQREQRVLSRTPMGRLGTPEDIGWAAVYLSSPAARFVTGSVLTVDGGASIGF